MRLTMGESNMLTRFSSRPSCGAIGLALLVPLVGCAIFSPFSLFSLVPGPKGPQGDPGPAGPDGQLRIYGDGSLGDVTVTQSTDLLSLVQGGSAQFRNLTI